MEPSPGSTDPSFMLRSIVPLYTIFERKDTFLVNLPLKYATYSQEFLFSLSCILHLANQLIHIHKRCLFKIAYLKVL